MSEDTDLLQFRRDKKNALSERGVDPYGQTFPVTHDPGKLRQDFQNELPVRLIGRITARRDMGKSQFFDISSIFGRIQCYLGKKDVGEESFDIFTKNLDLGDWIGVEGTTFTTKVGEPSVHVHQFTVLSKALRPLPDKWHGLADKEQKFRQRYLDLISNEESRRHFLLRSQILAEIRRWLQDRDFLEVETPMMQGIAGGAAARPFITHLNALDIPLYLRIAPELYLKRLLVGGFPKIFELNRNFRNEGLSRRHNPEFTMLEAYWAGADFEIMADLVESMICHLAEKFIGNLVITHPLPEDAPEGTEPKQINLNRPWKRARYADLLTEVDPEWWNYDAAGRRRRAEELGVEISAEMEDHEVTQQVFEKKIEEKTIDPLFVTHLPKELVPLAKQNRENPDLVDVYELIINGQEISPGYSELNDPVVQRARLEEQAGEEVQNIDEEFLLALEHGMPPAGGIGIGIDRLVMMLTGAESIRDVILFPQLRPKSN